MDRDPASLLDIVEAARRIGTYIAGFDRAAAESDPKTRAAVIYELLILGEAAKRVSAGFRAAHPSVPWSEMTRTRDRLIHGYDRIKFDVVWETITESIPVMLAAIEPLIPADDENE